MNTFSIAFLLRKNKTNKDNEAPVFMRVTIDGKRADISIQRNIKISKWDNGKPKGNSPESISMREYMENWRLKVYYSEVLLLIKDKSLGS